MYKRHLNLLSRVYALLFKTVRLERPRRKQRVRETERERERETRVVPSTCARHLTCGILVSCTLARHHQALSTHSLSTHSACKTSHYWGKSENPTRHANPHIPVTIWPNAHQPQNRTTCEKIRPPIGIQHCKGCANLETVTN